jgi:hypothetical protein
MRLAILLFVIFCYFASSEAKADCLACWELHKVEITFNTGLTKTGFVYWNDQWLGAYGGGDWAKWKNKFPESFVAHYKHKQDTFSISLIQRLYNIKNDSLPGFIATTEADIFKFKISDLKRIIEIDKGARRIAGAGEVLVYSLKEMEILKTNPFATFYVQESVFDAYLVSYNKEINREALRKLTAGGRYPEKDWKSLGVLFVVFDFD